MDANTGAMPGREAARDERVELLERAGSGRLFRGEGPVVDATADDAPQQIHVAPDDSADGDGTAEDPYGSLEAARDAVRELREGDGLTDGGVSVVLGATSTGGNRRSNSAPPTGASRARQ